MTSKLMCLGNLRIHTGISTLIHTTTLNTKLAQLELLYTGHKHYRTHKVASKTNIRVTTKPFKTLPRIFLPLNMYVIYNIPCFDCSWSYVGETGRSFQTRKKEHIRNVKNCKKGSNIDLLIDFKNGLVIDNYWTRKTLES